MFQFSFTAHAWRGVSVTLIDWDQIKQMFPSVWNEFQLLKGGNEPIHQPVILQCMLQSSVI